MKKLLLGLSLLLMSHVGFGASKRSTHAAESDIQSLLNIYHLNRNLSSFLDYKSNLKLRGISRSNRIIWSRMVHYVRGYSDVWKEVSQLGRLIDHEIIVDVVIGNHIKLRGYTFPLECNLLKEAKKENAEHSKLLNLMKLQSLIENPENYHRLGFREADYLALDLLEKFKNTGTLNKKDLRNPFVLSLLIDFGLLEILEFLIKKDDKIIKKNHTRNFPQNLDRSIKNIFSETNICRRVNSTFILLALLRYSDAEVKKLAAGALWNLAKNANNQEAIRNETNAITNLVALLRETDTRVKIQAVLALARLADNPDNNKAIRKIPGAVALLKENIRALKAKVEASKKT